MNLDDVISLVRALQVTNSDLVKRVTALEAEVVALKQQSSSSTPVAILSAATFGNLLVSSVGYAL